MTVLAFKRKKNSPPTASTSGAAAHVPPPPGVRAIGIDLGTTHSVVSLYEPGAEHPTTLLYDGEPLVPSLFYWDEERNTEVVGRLARLALESKEREVIRSTKTFMGSATEVFHSHGKTYTPEESAAQILKHIASHPELQNEIKAHGGIWAVITVPAHFNDAARMATIAAAREAQIHVLRIVNEPTAAALAYSMLPEVRDLQNETLAVYDLGGGTFDVSLVDRDGLTFNVLSSEGDVKLGGDDVDKVLAEHLLNFVTPKFISRRTQKDSKLFARLLTLAEHAKIQLSSQGEVHVAEDPLDGDGTSLNVTVSRPEFIEMCTPIVERTIRLTENAMHAARRQPRQVSRILLVGGSTRLVHLHKSLSDYFPCEVDARLEPDLAVSWGASLQAAIILGLEPGTILVDVCSHTLGIGIAEDQRSVKDNFKQALKHFGLPVHTPEDKIVELLDDRLEDFNMYLQGMLRVAPILHRNCALPARRSEFFSTIYKNQEGVRVVVVQGEEDTVGENKLIGSFMFALQQPCPAGSRCEIQLTYDVNGMVHVLARQMGTQNEAEAQFDSRTGEVLGWKQIRNESLDSDVGDTPNLNSVPSLPTPVADAPTAAQVVNPFVVQAKRHLMRLPADSPSRPHLQGLLKDYEELLNAAQKGEDNDAALEKAEEELQAYLEGKTP